MKYLLVLIVIGFVILAWWYFGVNGDNATKAKSPVRVNYATKYPPLQNTEGISFVSIDFETANNDKDSPCVMAICSVENGIINWTKGFAINPHEKVIFEEDFVKLHGVSPSDVSRFNEFDVVWNEEIKSLLTGKEIIAHFAEFDMEVLEKTLQLYKLDAPSFNFFCTCKIARKLYPTLQNHKLPTVCQASNIELSHHKAMSDAEACAKIALNAMITTGSKTLSEVYHKLMLYPVQSKAFTSPKKLDASLVWTHWESEVHKSKSQIQNIKNSVDCQVGHHLSPYTLSTKINGFTTSLTQCSCSSFKRNSLPCKHIYCLARHLGLSF